MNIKVYTKRRCSFCTAAKHWLAQRQYTFEEVSLDDPTIKESFVNDYPNLRTVPQIFVDGENIGGFSELRTSKLA
jgi:glutaredoxin 3